MKVKDSDLLIATTHPDNVQSSKIKWTSSDSSVLSVENGKVKALKAGNVFITASFDSYQASALVSISDSETKIHPLLTESLMSQYANSPTIVTMLNEMYYAIDPQADLQKFYDIAWNCATAEGFGLDIWGRIVGINRNVTFPDTTADYFGFNGSDGTPFNNAPFSGAGGADSTFELPDELFRKLILIKAMSNIIYATALNINKLLKFIFNDRCYFLITGHMKARYVFDFQLTPFEHAIVYEMQILPRPCGVLIDYSDFSGNTFGFFGTGFKPFNEGTFA